MLDWLSSLWWWLWSAICLYDDRDVFSEEEKPEAKEQRAEVVEMLGVHQRYFELLQRLSHQLETLITRPLSIGGLNTIQAPKPPLLPLPPPSITGTPKLADDKESRYRNIVRKWDRMAGLHKDEVVTEIVEQKPRVQNIAFTFRRIHPEHPEDRVVSQLDIEDPDLIQLLETIIHPYPGINFSGDLLQIFQPFAPIVR